MLRDRSESRFARARPFPWRPKLEVLAFALLAGEDFARACDQSGCLQLLCCRVRCLSAVAPKRHSFKLQGLHASGRDRRSDKRPCVRCCCSVAGAASSGRPAHTALPGHGPGRAALPGIGGKGADQYVGHCLAGAQLPAALCGHDRCAARHAVRLQQQ